MPSIQLSSHSVANARYATVTIKQPGKFNAMSRSMWRSLKQVFLELQQQTTAANPLRCVVLQGADGHFCSGGDIAEYPDFRFIPEQLQAFHEEDVWGALNAILQCDCPIVAAIAGNCMGGGLEIAACCDIRIATQDSRYGAPIAKLGFPMAPREAALLASKLGDTCTRSMLLEAAIYSAPHLHQQGFLTRLVANDTQLHNETEQSIHRILHLAPASARLNKQQLRQLPALTCNPDNTHQPINTNAATPTACAYSYATSQEHREGITAFLEKRPAQF